MTKKRKKHILKGTALSEGYARGKAFLYRDVLQTRYDFYDIEPDKVCEELTRFEKAVASVHKDLKFSATRVEKELTNQMADIFRAQAAILSDASLIKEIRNKLEQDFMNAEHVVDHVLLRWEKKFRDLRNKNLRQRADDIADLNRRMLHALQGIHANILETMKPGSILVAKRLLPSDTAYFKRKLAKAVLVELGGSGSHAALLTREYGIPSIGHIQDLVDHIRTGDELLVDANQGKVIINPTENEKEIFNKEFQKNKRESVKAKQFSFRAAKTKSGEQFKVMANVACLDDVKHAMEYGADGIGLYRTESLYMSRKFIPTLEEIVEEMRRVLEPAHNKHVTVRLLDVGGDKNLPFLNTPYEENPFLGRRGVRFLLKFPDLLKTQMAALFKLSCHFNLRILIPMVTVAEDIKKVRVIYENVKKENTSIKPPPLGIMVETPAAALCIDKLINNVDFVSLGTNDLTQYTMAAGRENDMVANYFLDDHPAVFELIKLVAKHSSKKSVSICGELAGKKSALKKIYECGIRELSVSPSLVPVIKEEIRRMK